MYNLKILVVGGAGYVGGVVTDMLMQRAGFHEFIVFDNLTFDDQYVKPCRFVRGDVRDTQALKPYLDYADVVVWLAALVGDGACEARKSEAIDINLNAVKFLAENFNGRILFTSTCSVYGAGDQVLSEESAVRPLSTYAQTKFEAEEVLRASKSNAVILRFGTLFGLSDEYSRVRFDLVVNTMTRAAHTNGTIQVRGGDQWRPLLHVRDAGRLAFKMGMECSPGVYNLHCFNTQVADIAQDIADLFGNVAVQVDGSEVSDARNYRVSSGPAHRMGYLPQSSLADGVRGLRSLLCSGRIRDPFSSRYSNEAYLKERGTPIMNAESE